MTDAEPRGLGAPAAGPAPAIVKKVKKVVETRLDAPELATALQQLSEFYGESSVLAPRLADAARLPKVERLPLCSALIHDSALLRAQHAREPTESAPDHRAAER